MYCGGPTDLTAISFTDISRDRAPKNEINANKKSTISPSLPMAIWRLHNKLIFTCHWKIPLKQLSFNFAGLLHFYLVHIRNCIFVTKSNVNVVLQAPSVQTTPKTFSLCSASTADKRICFPKSQFSPLKTFSTHEPYDDCHLKPTEQTHTSTL